MSIDGQRAGSAQHRVSPVAAGLAVFAGALMIVSGIGAVFQGIAAMINDEIFASTPQYVFAFDLTAWGWIHLFLGVLVGLAGVAVIRGQAWGRFIGIAPLLTWIAEEVYDSAKAADGLSSLDEPVLELAVSCTRPTTSPSASSSPTWGSDRADRDHSRDHRDHDCPVAIAPGRR